MNLSRNAKALAAAGGAFGASLAGSGALALFGADGLTAVLGLSACTGAAAGIAAFRVPNRTYGYNINDIADVLIQAGFDAAGEPLEEFDG